MGSRRLAKSQEQEYEAKLATVKNRRLLQGDEQQILDSQQRAELQAWLYNQEKIWDLSLKEFQMMVQHYRKKYGEPPSVAQRN